VDGTLVVSLDARVLNMSLTGLAVETTALLRLGATYWLRLPRGEEELTFQATVAWCHLVRTRRNPDGESVPVYHAGLDFRASLDDRARQILVFLKEHALMEVGERLAGRFSPRHRLAAELSSRYPFEVRRLSLSGMLIETPFAPEIGDQIEMEIDAPTGAFTATGAVRYVEPQAPETAGDAAPGDPAADEGGWLAGVELLRLEPEARDRLAQLLQSLLGQG
jgi:hypothetical protein